MLFTITILTAISILLQYIINYDKMEKYKKIFIIINLVVLISIPVLTYIHNVNITNKKKIIEKEIKKAELKIQVLSELDNYTIEIIEDIIKIRNNYPIIYNYFSWKEAMGKDTQNKYISWNKVASKENKNSLNEARNSFDSLHKNAKEIVNLYPVYYELIPEEFKQWVTLTLDMEFKDTLKYFSLLEDTKEEMQYAELLGSWVGKVKGELIIANMLKYESNDKTILKYNKMNSK